MEHLFVMNCVEIFILLIMLIIAIQLFVSHVENNVYYYLDRYIENYSSKYSFISKAKSVLWNDIRKALYKNSLKSLECKIILLKNLKEDPIENLIVGTSGNNNYNLHLRDSYKGEFEFVGFEYEDGILPHVIIYIRDSDNDSNKNKDNKLPFKCKEINLPIGVLNFYY